jgi:hypothetical protein
MTYEKLMSNEEFEGLLDHELNRGGARTGYSVKNDPSVVIKKVHQPFTGPNYIEWLVCVPSKTADGVPYLANVSRSVTLPTI